MNNSPSKRSHEADEQKIRAAEQAILKLDTSKTQSHIWELIRSLRACMEAGISFYVPLAPSESHELLEIRKMDLFGSRSQTPALRKVEMEKGGLAFCAFTTQQEMEQGPSSTYRQMSAEEIFSLALEDETVLGLILNPWGLSILLNKELLDLILNGEDEKPDDDDKGFQSAMYVDHSETCDQDTQIIVTASRHPFAFDEPGTRALLSAGGRDLQELCFSLKEPEPGSFVITDAPNLPAEKIFHAALPEVLSEKSCSALISSMLSTAEEMGFHSITLPAIGSEDGILNPDLPFVVIVAAAWFNAHPHSTLAVTIACRSQKVYQSFVSYLFE